MAATRSVILGTGYCLPQRVVTNAELATRVDTTDEWIQQRTGIRQRFVAGAGEYTSTLATQAARMALHSAGLEADRVDLILLATTTPDNTFPATAVKVQTALGATNAAAFDIQAVCSGFIYALTTANAYITAGLAQRILVIGAETFSRLLDYTDRTTCVLFGDGAGAVVLGASQSCEQGIIAAHIYSDGSGYDHLRTTGGVSTTQSTGTIHMDGRDVFKAAVERLAQAVETILRQTDTPASAIDWLIPHQANSRIIDSVAKKLNLPAEKVILTIAQHANTSAASVPLALATAVEEGRVKRGQLLLLEAMGGGFTWGACLLRY